MSPLKTVGVFLFAVLALPLRGEDSTPGQLFEKRILPIFRSPNPSSCVQCHLANVDLKNYILPSHEKTFISLRDQGLIDVDKPEQSKILKLINMREEDRRGAALLHEKTRQAEHAAFAAWIQACCKDEKLRAAAKLTPDELAKPARPVEVIRHARKDRLLASFEDNIWALRFRCMSCHTEGTPENAKHRQKHGERVTWIKAEGAEATMHYLMQSKLLDTREPEKSLLLLKPLGVVEHEGGKKILPGDQGYKAFRAWIEDYAKTVKDGYRNAAALPDTRGEPVRFGTDIWVKLSDTPPEWGDRLVQVNVHAWDAAKEGWEEKPVATTDRLVWGKGKLWQHNLTLLAERGSDREKKWKKETASLPPGRYLLRVYVDRTGKLGEDWKASLGEKDYAGAVEVRSNWPTGYGRMTATNASRVR